MIALGAKTRKEIGKKLKTLRQKGFLPAVLYGPKMKNENLELSLKEFEKVYQQVGESALISLEVDGKKKYSVLIHDLKRDPLKDVFLHVDFYQPSLTEKTEVKVPIVFDGEPEAVKNLGGTLVKNITEVVVRALPQSLPKEIRVNVSSLKTFTDAILIKDLVFAGGVEVLKNPGEIVAQVRPPEKVEEELQKPIEEKVEEVEKVEKEKKPAEAEAMEDKGEKVKKEEQKQEKK